MSDLIGNEILYYSSVAGNRVSPLELPCRTQDIANLANGQTQRTATGITANGQLGSVSLPANAFLLCALFRKTAGENESSVIGTTLGASDVMAPVAVPESGTVSVVTEGFSKAWLSAIQTQDVPDLGELR